jgi:mycothiol synthase
VAELLWRSALTAEEIDEVQALVAEATAVDGTAPLSEHVLLHLRHGGDAGAAQLLAREGAELVAFAHLDVTDPVAGGAGELVVRPAHRRAGLGTIVVQALLDRAAQVGSPAGPRLRLWAHGEHPGAVALAHALGFTQARVLWQMRRSLLAPLAEPRLPEGVRLRPFVVGADEREFLRVNNAAFAWHPEQSGWTHADIAERRSEPWFDAAGLFMAFDDQTGKLLGFHWTKVHNSDLGEVYVVGVDPAAQGRGVGATLTLIGLHHLAERLSGAHQPTVMLYVEADNSAAVNTYRRLGFEVSNFDVAYTWNH